MPRLVSMHSANSPYIAQTEIAGGLGTVKKATMNPGNTPRKSGGTPYNGDHPRRGRQGRPRRG